MKAQIESLGHAGWMRTACDEMCVHSASPSDARQRFAKIRGAAGLRPENLSVLREITALREQLAYERDVPPRALLKDEVLFDIADRLPENLSGLGRSCAGFPPESL